MKLRARRRTKHEEDIDRDSASWPVGRSPKADDSQVDLAGRLHDPVEAAKQLRGADAGTRSRLLGVLQRKQGNTAVGAIVLALDSSVHARTGGSGVGAGRGETITLERQAEEEAQEAEPMDAADITAADLENIPDGATEEVGPTTSSSYPVTAVSLSDVAGQLSARDEAGICGWKEAWTFRTSPPANKTRPKPPPLAPT